MNRFLISLILLLAASAHGKDKIVGVWDNSHAKKGLTQIWHFTERGNILREYRMPVGKAETFEWMSVSGRWEKRKEESAIYYDFKWFNKFESFGEFTTAEGIEYLYIAHGDLGYYLKPRKVEPVAAGQRR